MEITLRQGICAHMPLSRFQITNEPAHDKINKMACAPSEDTYQPGHPPSLIRLSNCAQWVAKDPSFLHTDSENSDQTGRMPRLICVFAGRTCHFVGLVMLGLKYFQYSD